MAATGGGQRGYFVRSETGAGRLGECVLCASHSRPLSDGDGDEVLGIAEDDARLSGARGGGGVGRLGLEGEGLFRGAALVADDHLEAVDDERADVAGLGVEEERLAALGLDDEGAQVEVLRQVRRVRLVLRAAARGR